MGRVGGWWVGGWINQEYNHLSLQLKLELELGLSLAILHGRRPRIQKMKCLAQKLTKWRRIEKLWRKREIDRFRELKELVRFALCKFPTHRRQSGSHFAQGGSILPKLVSMAS